MRHSKGDTSEIDRTGYRNLADAAKKNKIPRFVLVSILACDKADRVPHFYNKYRVEQYLEKIRQPFISLRAGAFLDQSRDFIAPKLKKGVLPSFVPGIANGMIYTPDLAQYIAQAAKSLPEKELNQVVSVGWSEPVTPKRLAKAFSKVLGKPINPKPAFPRIVTAVGLPIFARFSEMVSDMYEMIKWVKTGQYIDKNTAPQERLFGKVPTPEDVARSYSEAIGLI